MCLKVNKFFCKPAADKLEALTIASSMCILFNPDLFLCCSLLAKYRNGFVT